MAKDAFSSYGGKCDFFNVTTGKVSDFVSQSGGSVDPYGDVAKKDKSAINMDAASAFKAKTLSTVDAMGTEAPSKSGRPGQMSNNDGDHLKQSDVNAYGDDAGKSKSGQSAKRSGE